MTTTHTHRKKGHTYRSSTDHTEAELRDSAEAKLLDRLARGRRAVVAQLVYRDQPWQGAAKGREFSRDTMQVHWRQGVADVAAMLERRGWAGLPTGPGVWSFDATAQP